MAMQIAPIIHSITFTADEIREATAASQDLFQRQWKRAQEAARRQPSHVPGITCHAKPEVE